MAIKHIETFLQAHNEPFLEPQQPEKIVKAPLCAAVLQYFGYDNKPRKTLAQHWLQTLDPLVPTLHKKTNYQATPPTDTYAVTTLFPQMLVTQVGISWQLTDKKGVYRLFGFGLEIVVIVTREIPAAPHNVPWNLLSHDPELIRYALAQEPLPEDLLRYFDTTTLSC